MIQRVQTLYLLLAGIFPAITFFTPWSTLSCNIKGEPQTTLISSLSIDSTINEMTGLHPVQLLFIVACSIVIAFCTIFAFKNRKRQIRMTWAIVICNLLSIAGAAGTTYFYNSFLHATITPEVGLSFPILAIVAALMARRAIKHDEALVRAADRIR